MSSKQSASKTPRKSAARKGAGAGTGRPAGGQGAPARPAGPTDPRPARLTAAAALSGLEGVALVASGIYLLVMGLLGKPDSPQQAETGGLTVLALAALPLVAARGLWLRRRWSRGPAMITQIMALPVAWTLANAGGALMIAAGVVLALVAVGTLALLVNPTATEALGITPRDV
ncbi:membrane protein [Streptomyces eurocidicus]|uniref:Membrane protein n=1 Tax=Streptomyces eurocidicus TaxID=66423 RepID=A0A2N8NR72_STREU|nr:hypothetical protein [Streptomyces eurocidicus]MBB5117053.1 hypothetical protein [Streptomyces eurocidicus]MBF6052650.1 hypothetical protein [Streptomyces eurocidicus]PNE31262.1 membrane protein [Streptomyces eurocidicus]